jgi:hypothetical protein
MRIKLIFLSLLAIFWDIYGYQNGNLEYLISNFTDSIFYDSIVSFDLIIRNTNDKSLIIKRTADPIEIFIRKENDLKLLEQKVGNKEESICLELGPKKEINQTLKFSIMFKMDTVICPEQKPYLKKAKASVESTLANMIGLCSKVYLEKPLLKGNYEVVIVVNISEKDNKMGYFRIIKKLKIK